MARHAAKSTSQSADSTIGNYEKVRLDGLIEEHIARPGVTLPEIQWWSALQSRLLAGALDDDE